MPSFTTRFMLWAAVFAGAVVVLDAAGTCPTLAVKGFSYRIRVDLPQGFKNSDNIDATTLRFDSPVDTDVHDVVALPKNSDVTVRMAGSTTFFEGMQEAKRYNFRVKVRGQHTSRKHAWTGLHCQI